MKNTLLIFLLTCCSLAAQQLPFYLQDKEKIDVSGTITGVSSEVIVVSNAVLVCTPTSHYGVERRGRFIVGVTTQGPNVISYASVYYWVRNYPHWRQVKIGDKMSTSAYLIASASNTKTVVYFVPVTTPQTQTKVWR